MSSIAEITKTSQYLTFRLGEETFAVDVGKVHEVLELTTITKVPRTPEFMRGVINLRGSVVPVIDMRLKLGMSKIEQTVDTCIVVMDIAFDGETTQLGAVADSVKEVIDLEPDQIEPPPKICSTLKIEFIRGIGKRDEQFIIILDIDKIFSTAELIFIQKTEGEISAEKKGPGRIIPTEAEKPVESILSSAGESSESEPSPPKPALAAAPVK